MSRAMSTDAHEELYKLLLDTATETPLEVVANCVEIMATVMNKRLHDLNTDGPCSICGDSCYHSTPEP